jgi:cbb3-type cytochrome oxidase maturation protein
MHSGYLVTEKRDNLEVIYLLILLSLVFIVLIALVYFWAVRSGQYDDMEKPRHDILMDDDQPPE